MDCRKFSFASSADPVSKDSKQTADEHAFTALGQIIPSISRAAVANKYVLAQSQINTHSEMAYTIREFNWLARNH
jgi:hypothetical protein